jgi:uroporphyrinogen-III decarboxylase
LKVKNALPKKIQNPETVNFNEPPAKLLERLFPMHMNRSYKKVVNGKELFGKLDPNIAYQKCQKLKELLDKMLELAQQPH